MFVLIFNLIFNGFIQVNNGCCFHTVTLNIHYFKTTKKLCKLLKDYKKLISEFMLIKHYKNCFKNVIIIDSHLNIIKVVIFN